MVRTLLAILFVLVLQNGRAEATCGDYLLHVPRETRLEGVMAFEPPGDRDLAERHPKSSPCANGECRPAPAPSPEPPTLPVRNLSEAALSVRHRPSDASGCGRMLLRRSVHPLEGVPLSIDRPPRQFGAL
ncbi:hypothetical protein [Maioricimonas rarisocia]|nr:hypothetical protein [Maioricimonas rarisocia]